MKASIIRDVLQDNGFKLKDVAESLGISSQHLNNMWSVKDVKIGTLLRFVEVTKIPLLEFLTNCEHVNKVDENLKQQYNIIKENMKQNETPLEFYNPNTQEFSSVEKDGFHPLIMWMDGRHSELLYQKGESVCYGTLPCYRFNENTAMALSTNVLRYTTKDSFERFMKMFDN